MLIAHQAINMVTITAAVQPSATVCHLAPLDTRPSSPSLAPADSQTHQANLKRRSSDWT